jgi:hypothetical protein
MKSVRLKRAATRSLVECDSLGDILYTFPVDIVVVMLAKAALLLLIASLRIFTILNAYGARFTSA